MIAGFVNAAGFLGLATLTTNVTGHAALFAERIALQDWANARVIALWMLLFLAGAFLSSFIVSRIGRNNQFSYVVPILIEMMILAGVAVEGHLYDQTVVSKELFAGSLLFSMGLQNALVSIISGSVVRTTHLTGTFTDLGIELAQILDKKRKDKPSLRSKIILRVVIIIFFMAGALAGAWLFRAFRFHAFLFPVVLLLFTLFYDMLRIKLKKYYRRTFPVAPVSSEKRD